MNRRRQLKNAARGCFGMEFPTSVSALLLLLLLRGWQRGGEGLGKRDSVLTSFPHFMRSS